MAQTSPEDLPSTMGRRVSMRLKQRSSEVRQTCDLLDERKTFQIPYIDRSIKAGTGGEPAVSVGSKVVNAEGMCILKLMN